MNGIYTPNFEEFCNEVRRELPSEEAARLIAHEARHREVALSLGYSHQSYSFEVENTENGKNYDAATFIFEKVKDEDLLKILWAPKDPSDKDWEDWSRITRKLHAQKRQSRASQQASEERER